MNARARIPDVSSEFGRGYATCLRQFANHRGRLDEWMREKPFSSEEMMVELWFNGASDHLYDIERANVSDMEWARAAKLASRAVFLGHGFMDHANASEAYAMLDEAEALLALLEMPTANLEDAMATDRLLGIEPEQGDFSCPLDLHALHAPG
jgi:hypothetical protein